MDRKMRERETRKAAQFWAGLATERRWQLGDELVLGDFDWREWLDERPSGAFLRALDDCRIAWEVGL